MKRREACSSLLLLLVAALYATAVRAQLAGGDARFTVGHFDVQLEPNPASRSITGTAVVTIIPAHDGVETVTLNRGNLDIDRISENGSAGGRIARFRPIPSASSRAR